ncbi:Transcriptional regulatory protein [Lachnellula willkommii]|uniref:Transcriptional regulatory protein n=1 Tax=Lachnellula willkommii TaxID=215461 RepID=A0A559M0G7_9HELO|nr:Transcriptional regulatory protein [Lachnellula willkommii]
MVAQIIQQRRRRACGPKTRTGCFTCKIRRVKCDEAKPACNRCSSTGRKCDGFPQDPSSSSNDGDSPDILTKQISTRVPGTIGAVHEEFSAKRLEQGSGLQGEGGSHLPRISIQKQLDI